jgi:hypothetical protein
MKEENWTTLLYHQVLERNQKQSYPYLHIYSKYDQSWKKNIKYESSLESSRHTLFLLEHENNEYVMKKDINSLLDNTKSKIELLQSQLKPVINDEYGHTDIPTILSSSLSRQLFDQKKLLSAQSEELLVAKQELQRSIDSRACLETELHQLRERFEYLKSSDGSDSSNVERDQMIYNLQQENIFLTQKLKDEKDKAAVQLNDMNVFLECKRDMRITFSPFFCFLALRTKQST